MAAPRVSRVRARRREASVLRPADFRAYLASHAAEIAPRDVATLVADAPSVRDRAAKDLVERPAFARRVEAALALLVDHDAGACPQIPYATVATLAAALFYYLEPLDVIPDVIPGRGSGDDALVMEIAFAQAAPGIQRYLDFTGRPIGDLVPGRNAPRRDVGRPRHR